MAIRQVLWYLVCKSASCVNMKMPFLHDSKLMQAVIGFPNLTFIKLIRLQNICSHLKHWQIRRDTISDEAVISETVVDWESIADEMCGALGPLEPTVLGTGRVWVCLKSLHKQVYFPSLSWSILVLGLSGSTCSRLAVFTLTFLPLHAPKSPGKLCELLEKVDKIMEQQCQMTSSSMVVMKLLEEWVIWGGGGGACLAPGTGGPSLSSHVCWRF